MESKTDDIIYTSTGYSFNGILKADTRGGRSTEVTDFSTQHIEQC